MLALWAPSLGADSAMGPMGLTLKDRCLGPSSIEALGLRPFKEGLATSADILGVLNARERELEPNSALYTASLCQPLERLVAAELPPLLERHRSLWL